MAEAGFHRDGREVRESFDQFEVLHVEGLTIAVRDNPNCSSHFTCLPWDKYAVGDGVGFDVEIVIVGLANSIELRSATIERRPAGTKETWRRST